MRLSFCDRISRRRNRLKKAAIVVVAGAAVSIVGVRPTQDAVAQGGTRTLTILHAHTKEQETVTYKRFGSYDSAGLQKLNWLLRDWRQDEPTRMDPQLFDIMWEVYRESGSSAPITVVSAYRSPGTNAMLARRSRGVAKNSQHMSGRALDFHFPDVSVARIRDIGLRLQSGGVGYYPNANNPWVHLDTGGVRHWPKVSRDHLVRLFPDERTVHIPSDGKPLAGFEAARAIIEARGGSVSSGYIDIAEGRATGKTLFQILFGGGDEEEGEVAGNRGRRGRTAVASRSRTQVAALPPEAVNEASAVAFFAQNNSNTTAVARPETPGAQAGIRARAARPAPEPAPAAAVAQPAPVAQPTPEPKREEPPKAVAVAALQPAAAPVSTRSDADDDKGRPVNIPLPQRRPAGIQIGPTLVNIPLPQSRPATLLAAADDGKAEETATAEAQKSIQVASAARAASIPLPASRPAGLPPAITGGLRTGTLDGGGPTLAYAPTTQPQQFAPTQGPAPAPSDRAKLNSLISQIAATANADRGARVSPASVAAVAEIRTVTGSFAPAPPRVESGFTGSAIRPLATQGFRRAE